MKNQTATDGMDVRSQLVDISSRASRLLLSWDSGHEPEGVLIQAVQLRISVHETIRTLVNCRVDDVIAPCVAGKKVDEAVEEFKRTVVILCGTMPPV